MKNFKIALASCVFALSLTACSKNAESSEVMTETIVTPTDSVSYAAKQTVEGKKFVKTASVDMEVKDVYDATVSVEKVLENLNGFVTSSRLVTSVVSQETFETSDEEAVLVKKFQTENRMQVRVPTQHLSEFLTQINTNKLFLNSRIITAEDVTNNEKIAVLHAQKITKTAAVIDKMKNDTEKVVMTENSADEGIQQATENLQLADNLKYSTVDLVIKEPQLRIAQIPVTNSKNIDNQYKSNFLYDAKNSFVEGFYLIQRLAVALISIWPVLLLAFGIYFFVRKKKTPTAPDTES